MNKQCSCVKKLVASPSDSTPSLWYFPEAWLLWGQVPWVRGLLSLDGLPRHPLGSDLGRSGAFLHTDEVSLETQFQGLNLSLPWSWREIFYSEVQVQKTGKQMAKKKMGIP